MLGFQSVQLLFNSINLRIAKQLCLCDVNAKGIDALLKCSNAIENGVDLLQKPCRNLQRLVICFLLVSKRIGGGDDSFLGLFQFLDGCGHRIKTVGGCNEFVKSSDHISLTKGC